MPAQINNPVRQFIEAVTEAALLLEQSPGAQSRRDIVSVEPLPSLLEQCRSLCERAAAEVEPVRTVHHFACTGGTLISKCIAAMPNTELLSEVDPLSSLTEGQGKPHFAPSDVLYLLRHSARRLGDEALLNVFLATVSALHDELSLRGGRLVVRDHTHGHFCGERLDSARPTLRQILARRFPVRSVVTVRHPLDSFMSLQRNGWVRFSPATLDEYCARYLCFLEAYAEEPVHRYEDFVLAPEEVMQEICNDLSLPYDPMFVNTFDVIRLTGDSGRSSAEISLRGRREVPESLVVKARESGSYRQLCEQLGYRAETGFPPGARR